MNWSMLDIQIIQGATWTKFLIHNYLQLIIVFVVEFNMKHFQLDFEIILNI